MRLRRSILALAMAAVVVLPGLAFGAPGKANFAGVRASSAARSVADWVVSSKDNGAAPFFIIDKKQARLYVFNERGRLQGVAPVLLGLAHGDESAPGIGHKPLKEIRPEERTTPAGRFVAQKGRNADKEDIVWVSYADAVSLHRVRPLNPSERRLERLRSPTWRDNRISYGCINVPVWFYNGYVNPAFKHGNVVVYILPDVKTVADVFPRNRTFAHSVAALRRVG